MRVKMRPIQRSAALLLAFVLCASASGHGEDTGDEQLARPDILKIAVKKSIDDLERPPVEFPHDLHTDALKEQGKDCTACHPTLENGRLSLLFERLEPLSPAAAEEIYHDRCIGCHVERASEGLKTGPDACGDCHAKKPVYTSSLKPFGFDKSLHYRHIKANDDKCDPCHHIYDEKTKQLVYVKGQENPCRDCHLAETTGNRSSFRVAAHESCLDCHRKIASQRPDQRVGPLSCRGCHDLQHQKAIKVVENPPRLQRGQPDFVLLGPPEADLELSKLNTVPFSHVDHERVTNTCRACHHKELVRCNHCHTLPGSERSEGVTLRQAMHRMTSNHSCVGCHQLEESDKQCAGCHDLMEKGRLSEHACGICHCGPPEEEVTDALLKHASMDTFRPKPAESTLGISASDVPDTVTIRALSPRYPAVKMPHGKIVATLKQHIADSKIATHFHGSEDVVCQGCHHHGSIGNRPALCENCHGEPFRKSDLYTPGLKGAYHRQCLGCHLSMGLQTESNCTVCHGDVDLVGETTSLLPGEGQIDE
jgi:hypothetical protein